jgi:hypothetical protein
MGALHKIYMVLLKIYILSWDIPITLLNIVLPQRPVGKVIRKGYPGFDGRWPEYVPRKQSDSRCSCPAINAMANHGQSKV